MSAVVTPADRGRLPGDPSLKLIELIRTLQHMQPSDSLIPVDHALYREAHNWTVSKGCAIHHRDNLRCLNMLFCGQWITPVSMRDAAP